MSEIKRQEFKKLLEQCIAFKEDIDYYEMKDVRMTNIGSEGGDSATELQSQLKTAEDKLQQMLYNEYRQNKHSVIFEQMQEAIINSRNGNLIGGLIIMKINQHDYEDMEKIIAECVDNRAGREAIEEIGKHHPRLLKIAEKIIVQSQDFRLINFACYIDGINVNKLAQAVMKMNDLEKLQEFGEQHAEDLSIRTRRMMAQRFKQLNHMSMNDEHDLERVRDKRKK